MLYMLCRGVNLNSNERTKAEKGSTPDRSGASKHLRFAWVLGVGFRVEPVRASFPVCVGVLLGVSFGVSFGVSLSVSFGVSFGVSLSVSFGVSFGVSLGELGVILLCE